MRTPIDLDAIRIRAVDFVEWERPYPQDEMLQDIAALVGEVDQLRHFVTAMRGELDAFGAAVKRMQAEHSTVQTAVRLGFHPLEGTKR